MTDTLIDTNVLLDLATNDLVWADWSIAQLNQAASRGSLLVNDIVYTRASVRFPTIEVFEDFLRHAAINLTPTPRAALFLAGQVFRRYRSAGGTRTGVLPDFFIGAHAAVTGLTLLSRDAGRYRTYSPTSC